MTCTEVHDQAEFDTAAARGDCIHVTGSATVEAYGSATVRASGSATVRAYDSATVRAYDSATVRAYDSATVEASKFVPVQDHGPMVTVTGGVLISIRPAATPTEWCDFYGVDVTDGIATLYKAVEDDWRGSHKTTITYEPGTTPAAPDWDDGEEECGGGLHFSPRPFMARSFCRGVTHYIACPVAIADMAVHPNPDYPEKIKAARCAGPVWECDEDGQAITPTAGADALAQLDAIEAQQ